MSQGQREIECRRCKEIISLDAEQCPHCGTSQRGRAGPIVGIVVGILMALSSLFSPELWFFGGVGVIVAVFCGYLLYDKRERIRAAGESAENADAESGDEPSLDFN
jgi:hypothetical protein